MAGGVRPLEQCQEKWKPVFRPTLRKTKETAPSVIVFGDARRKEADGAFGVICLSSESP
jgi:hypothetical protein